MIFLAMMILRLVLLLYIRYLSRKNLYFTLIWQMEIVLEGLTKNAQPLEIRFIPYVCNPGIRKFAQFIVIACKIMVALILVSTAAIIATFFNRSVQIIEGFSLTCFCSFT